MSPTSYQAAPPRAIDTTRLASLLQMLRCPLGVRLGGSDHHSTGDRMSGDESVGHLPDEQPSRPTVRSAHLPVSMGFALGACRSNRPSQLGLVSLLLAKISTNHVICMWFGVEPNPCEPPRSSLSPANPGMLVSARLVVELKLFGEWRSCDEVCEIWRCEPLNVSNAKIPKNVVNRRHRFLTNDVAKASFKSVLECQPRKCG